MFAASLNLFSVDTNVYMQDGWIEYQITQKGHTRMYRRASNFENQASILENKGEQVLKCMSTQTKM